MQRVTWVVTLHFHDIQFYTFFLFFLFSSFVLEGTLISVLKNKEGSTNIMVRRFILTSKTKGPPGFSLNNIWSNLGHGRT